jgi:A/G-specific adenine glycosylase
MTIKIAPSLLAWYDLHRRVLPWRALPGETPDPYRVWISEIMLQQTVAATVVPYFNRFIQAWPDVQALAATELDQVLAAWAGLGYYARGRNLHACARAVVEHFGGTFPSNPELLKTLPGIGDYTAGAIAAIAFDLPFAAVDGNVERVVSRLLYVTQPLPDSRPGIRIAAQAMVPERRAGDFAQAMMDLGATICTPGRPKCLACPLSSQCQAFALGEQERLPRRKAKAERPVRFGRVYWIENQHGDILVRRRAEKGLLGGMMEFPSSEWVRIPPDGETAYPFQSDWKAVPGKVVHVFTHFRLELEISRTVVTGEIPLAGQWAAVSSFDGLGLPGLMRKIAAHTALAIESP